MEYSKNKLKKELETKKFNFKKKFGQNFIIDQNTINSIITKSQIPEETLVIEIGPGAGSLTNKLAAKAQNVLAYEIDNDIKEVLEKNISKNTKIIYDDFLNRNVLEDIKEYKYKYLYLIANLPYYITTPIIMKIIQDKLPIDKIVIMVQKEVGDRFKANPNTKEYNSLSVYLNYYFKIEKIMNVSRNVFIPKPNVDSIVLSLTPKEKYSLKNEEVFFKLVKDSFKQKRKTLKNNLKEYDLDTIETTLKEHNLDLNVRAEALPIDIFIEIANKLSK